jgi:hypothetical protein
VTTQYTDWRDHLMYLVDEGYLDPHMALTMCLKWMTQDEVGEMVDANELSPRFMEADDAV